MQRGKSPSSQTAHTNSNTTTITTTTTSPRPEPTIVKRRNSSFANTSSPWFRRNSFLSPAMIQDENFNVYESGTSFYSGMNGYASNYSIISLRECQGFLFNQDLFATPYQQVRSQQANAKKYRSSSSSTRRTSGTGTGGGRKCRDGDYERRHTSYHPPRPQFDRSNVSDHAIVDDDEDAEDDEDEEMHDANEEFSSSGGKHHEKGVEDKDGDEDGEEEDEEADEEEDDDEGEDQEEDDDDDDDEDEDDYREMHEYGGDFNNRRFKVRVTEILVDENEDHDIFPTSEI
ncbi:hypothetical protein FOB58_001326 [Candida parapsilosis]|uniref:Uncharacterized protein n=2 Tax=Candida parapsilosis TaxID=5480 RepID=G8BEY5_CANPC|nr:uncharacterized protein CPAR2_200860 [Candida parapsilosis]KAF6055404.1 hypothetical protein FOB58_001326 [Candida parapsilosis]KAF6055573.1 hypothetical protein FOB59_000085 [Candida parapsilosis]KAF6058503.1 hypothetical protein FOB60_000085 [Candida parapsilosis]KAF6067260.1 hypothetical protein FOB61_000085 [Candida parapsilosis]KAI5903888.1 hypothetical protein K4G60_g3045 [Candida parapsilosis]